jgi:adenine-specific DNA methylase
MIEKDYDVSFVAAIALREKQIQQNYRPVIAVHKWFARRPGTLFRSLLLSEFGYGTLRDIYFKTNDLKGLQVADPFMGGGTPLLEANRLGCDVIGYDINPMAYWIVHQEITSLDLHAYRQAADKLVAWLENKIGSFYRTQCLYCRAPDADVKYFLWVKMLACHQCGQNVDLFPGYLLAEDRRHPQNVFICPTCGALTETRDRQNPGVCQSCNARLSRSGPAKGNRCLCPHCHTVNS